jgi:mannose-6-phosphate isomerase-like protein (cupin superfamily)
MPSELQVIDVETLPVAEYYDGKEQLRRAVTTSNGYEKLSLLIIHFEANLEKEMFSDPKNRESAVETVLFVLSGSARFTVGDKEFEVRPGMAVCTPPRIAYHHKTGPLGMTVALCMTTQ